MPLDASYGLPRGRNAMVAWVLGTLLVICMLSVHRSSIKYETADASYDAMRALAHGDTRYLAVKDAPLFVPLPPGQSLPAGAPLEVDRDIRLVPRESPGSAEAAQNAYLGRYNATMTRMVYKPGHGEQVRRPAPMPRPMFAVVVSLALLPMILTFYLRYRLGPYRRDGSSWTVDFWRVLPVYILPRTYTEAARPLLLVLWIDVALIIPWAVLVIFVFGDKPLA